MATFQKAVVTTMAFLAGVFCWLHSLQGIRFTVRHAKGWPSIGAHLA